MLRRPSLTLFFVAALVPFGISFVLFVVSARESLLTPPREHIATLKRAGSTTTLVSLAAWKAALAEDASCRTAAVIIIGSSRVREIDRDVTGTTTCNLYVDGLATGGFLRLARALPPLDASAQTTVYAGIDHFWLWSGDVDTLGDWTGGLADRAPRVWKAWQVARTLTFFQWRDLVETADRYRRNRAQRDDATSVWYPDGHLEHPVYYQRKRAGEHARFTRAEAVGAAEAIFTAESVRSADLDRLSEAVQILSDKGYRVRLYWNPVSPAHIKAAQEHFGTMFRDAIAAVDRVAPRLPLDRYVPAAQTIDAGRLGCADTDYFDTTHVDADCMRRLFATVFHTGPNLPATRPAVVPTSATPD